MSDPMRITFFDARVFKVDYGRTIDVKKNTNI